MIQSQPEQFEVILDEIKILSNLVESVNAQDYKEARMMLVARKY